MATSIDKSVNWRNAAATPDYQVTAQRVDTFVQGERNTRGEQVAAALDSAAGTVSQVGKKQLAKLRQEQEASLSTTQAIVQKELKDGTIKRIEQSKNYTVLPEYLRIRLAQGIGRDDDAVMYNDMLTAFNKDPNIALTDDALENFLGKYNVTVDGKDGYNIHRQAAQLDSLNKNKIKFRADAQSKRTAHNERMLTDRHTKDVTKIFMNQTVDEDGNKVILTGKQMWDQITELDKGLTGLDNTAKNKIYFEVAKQVAETTGKTDILQDHNISNTDFKNPLFDIINSQVSYKMEQRSRATKTYTDQQEALTKKLNYDKARSEAVQSLIDTGAINFDAIEDPLLELELVRIMEQPVVGTTASNKKYNEVKDNVRSMIYGITPYKGDDGVAREPSISDMRKLIYNTKGMDMAFKKKLEDELEGFYTMSGVLESPTYRRAVAPSMVMLENNLFNTFEDGLDGSNVLVGQITSQIQDAFVRLYQEAEADGVVKYSEEITIREEIEKEAARILEINKDSTNSTDSFNDAMSDMNFDDDDDVVDTDDDVVEPPVKEPTLRKGITENDEPEADGYKVTAKGETAAYSISDENSERSVKIEQEAEAEATRAYEVMSEKYGFNEESATFDLDTEVMAGIEAAIEKFNNRTIRGKKKATPANDGNIRSIIIDELGLNNIKAFDYGDNLVTPDDAPDTAGEIAVQRLVDQMLEKYGG